MNWIQTEIQNKESQRNDYVVLTEGKNYVTIDVSKAPNKREQEFEGRKRAYHEFNCLDQNNTGKLLSCTDYLYGKILAELKEHAESNIQWAALEIRKEKETPTKTHWTVIIQKTG